MKIHERFSCKPLSWVGIGAITLYPFILYSNSAAVISTPLGRYVRRHEWQHVSQVRTVGWFRFYLSYLWQALRSGFKHDGIAWEKDAIAHQFDMAPPANCPDYPTI